MLELKNIRKSYGNLDVLRGVNLRVDDGEIVALLGPSGAGKTTLLQIAGTLDKPDSGDVLYDGIDPMKLSDRKLAEFRGSNIGFIFQFHELLPEFTALENVAVPGLIARRKRKEVFANAEKLLRDLGLGERLHHKPTELSGGEKQRVAIARSLINNPRLILADEPTGSLDSHNRDEILSLISGLSRERKQSFLIVTHDPTLTEIADRTIHIDDGKVVESGEEEIPLA
ncbi:MAG: ABC transporter ATP-binding protein [Muribaculaceae bacterium]|nr:ABC transporter ATP-binding protein [Muribaculaceae bacterium]